MPPPTPAEETRILVSHEHIEALRSIARSEGKTLEALIQKACSEYLSTHQNGSRWLTIQRHFDASLREFHEIYRGLDA
ncbi:hypothetical protein [Thioalkalivibrio thiocyanodenitrificans]|uniref:hypothetical protein n=1 Tax=Thioalkalivibrio thiocyanodenitrificans TaxID=243063 RepID=UPI00036B1401|nr:hypothetical protein [Thioalkalivibrio thiocyanodenitrificans]